MLSRRSFLLATGSTVAALALRARETNYVPASLDHILLGCGDLDAGVAFVEQRTGVRAMYGGVHPGRGTRNALLSLGEGHYLEIIAPDAAQPDATNPLALRLKTLSMPRLVEWAAHTSDIARVADKLRASQVAFDGPTPGSRKLPSGNVLHWKTLTLKENPGNLLPFLIEWAPDAPHPSTDAPHGCRLVRFELLSSEPDSFAKSLGLLSLNVGVSRANQPGLHAIISALKGDVHLSS